MSKGPQIDKSRLKEVSAISFTPANEEDYEDDPNWTISVDIYPGENPAVRKRVLCELDEIGFRFEAELMSDLERDEEISEEELDDEFVQSLVDNSWQEERDILKGIIDGMDVEVEIPQDFGTMSE